LTPGCSTAGTIEDLLLEAGRTHYSDLLDAATRYVDAACSLPILNAKDTKDFKRPAGRKKANMAAAAAILRPGKSIQVSLQDNRWLTPPIADGSYLAHLESFRRAIKTR
jgi:hypothetical protein